MVLSTNKKISDYKGIKKLQHRLSVSNFNDDFQNLFDAAPTARDEARFRSFQGKAQADGCMHYQPYTDSHSTLVNFAWRAV